MTTSRCSTGAAVDDWPSALAELRSSLSFASCYVYTPRGAGMLSVAARLLCQRVKSSDPLWLPRFAREVVELCARERPFERLFAHAACLVPVPGCAPGCAKSTAACQLALALRGLGLGAAVWPGITRRVAVPRSATAPRGGRPTVRQHFESFAVAEAPGLTLQRIVLVDDVITRGRTLLAAAARLRCEFSHADIRAFALVRTLGYLSRLDRILAPCVGVVYWAGGDARREP